MMRNTKFLLILIMLIGAVLRIFHLGTFSFCIDEGFTFYTISRTTITQMMHCVQAAQDTPPLYFILMRFWLFLGNSEFMLRLFSAIFGILSIYAIYKLGSILVGEKVGLISAFLLTISPLHIYFSQMAKMYTLCIFLSLMAFYFYIRLLHKNNFVSWLSWLITTTLAVYTHYFAFFIILMGTLFIFFYYKKYKYLLKKWFLASGFIALVYSFWLPVLFNSLKGAYAFESNKPLFLRLVELPKLFYTFSIGFTTFDTTSYATVGNDIVSHLWIILPTVLIFSLLIALALFHFRNASETLIWLLLFLFFPVLVTFVINFALNSRLFQPRYLLMFSGPYYILTAIGVIQFKKTIYKIISILLIILLCGFSLNNYYFNKQYQRSEDWRAAANYINLHGKKGDLILICFPTPVGDPLDYYKNNLKKINLYDFVNPLKDNEVLFDKGMKEIVNGYNRIWFCRYGNLVWDREDRIMNWLEDNYSNFTLVNFYKLDFYLVSENKLLK